MSLFPRKILSLLLCLALLTLFSGCGRETAPRAAEDGVRTVRIAYLPITHALPLFREKEATADGSPVRVELVKYSS